MEAFSRAHAGAGVDRARLGQVQHRPPQGRGGRGRHAQDHARAARQGAAAEPQLRAAQPERGLDRVAVRRQHRAARLGGRRRPRARRRRQRVRLRRHQLPPGHGGVRARPSRAPTAIAPRSRCRRRSSPCRASEPRGPRAREAAPARRARARRRGRRGARQRAADRAGGGAPGAPPRSDAPSSDVLRAPERIAIDYADGPDLVAKAELASRVLDSGNPAAWPALRARGIHRGSGSPGKVAFLYTGQGSQYANMLAELRRREPVVAELFEEADAIMAPLLEGRRCPTSCSPTRRIRRRWRGPRRSCAGPRSSSRP